MSILNILGGFTKGYARGKMLKEGKQERLAAAAEKKKLIDLQIKSQQLLLKQHEDTAKWNDIIRTSPQFLKELGISPDAIGGQPQGPGKIPFGDSFDPLSRGAEEEPTATQGVDVAGTMSAAQMSPLTRAVVSKASGIDFLGAGRLTEQQLSRGQRHEEYLGRMGESRERRQLTAEGLDIQRETLKMKHDKVSFKTFEKGGITFRQAQNEQTKQAIGEPVAISGKKGLPVESAAKLQMMKGGLEDTMAVASILAPGGKIDWMNIANMQMGMPKSKGRTAMALMRNAIEAKLRPESGAAVPPEEVVRAMQRFQPKIGDSDELVKIKLNNLARFLSGTIEILDPNKRYGTDVITYQDETGAMYAWTPGERIDLFKSKDETELINEMDKALE